MSNDKDDESDQKDDSREKHGIAGGTDFVQKLRGNDADEEDDDE